MDTNNSFAFNIEHFTDEQITYIGGNSKNASEIIGAIAVLMSEMDELEKLPHSQNRNRRRKWLEYQLYRLKKRLDTLTERKEKRAKDKKMQRLETKAKEEVILQTLVTKLANTAASSSNKQLVSSNAVFIPKQAVIDTGDIAVDKALNALKDKYKAGKSFQEIRDEEKQKVGNSFTVEDLFVRNEDGGVDL